MSGLQRDNVMKDEELIRRYLLGELIEEEQPRVQDRLLTDHEFFGALQIVENDLIDEYACGEINGHERERIRDFFLAAPERRPKLKFARALKKYGSETAVPDTSEATLETRPLLPFLLFRNRAMKWALAAAAAIVLAAGTWLVAERARLAHQLEHLRAAQSRAQQREEELARSLAEQQARNADLLSELEQQQSRYPDVDQLPKDKQSTIGTFLSFVLLPGLTRDEGKTNRLEIPQGTSRVRLQLVLEDAGFENYLAKLQTAEGSDVWSGANLKAQQLASGKAVIVRLPARLLTAGDYILTLRGASAGGGYERAGAYHFRVSLTATQTAPR